MRDAVLQNRVQAAFERDATLAASTDLALAEPALAAQLIELEALAARTPEPRVLALLSQSYDLWAQGFVELRRLEALAAGDTARAERERRQRADAEARATEYARLARSAPRADTLAPFLAAAMAACRERDASRYERELGALLAREPRERSEALRLALAQRHAAAWLMPRVAERCQLTPVAPSTPPPASG